jgi:DNA polymerase IV (archaeal DinB-like DNA polymerase)
MSERIIILLDMDCFFAQVEERESPQFQGKPVVVGADPKGGKGRGVVSTSNYKAREYGIHSALPISKAYQLCPEAIFLPPNFELYSATSSRIMKIIESFAEQVEPMSLDEAYIDVSFAKTYVKAEKIAQKMRKEILRQEKLECSCGVGPNKMIAKIACEAAKPNGVKVVTAKDAEAYMENLSVRKLPGVGVKTAQIFYRSGMNTVSDLKKLSPEELGEDMYYKVRGIDESPVVTEREVKSIGKEVTFEQDTRDPEILTGTFERLSQEVAREVQEQKLRFKTITVVCRFTGFQTHTKSKTLPEPSSEAQVLRAEGMKLLMRFLVENKKPLRLIGVRVTIERIYL